MSLRSLAAGAGASLERAVNEDAITLAVTGLSRAGKTVFITSLIQNLLALAAQKNVLPKLTARLSDGGKGINRLRDVTILSPGISALPYFDQAAKLAGLSAAEPTWPERTTDIARISLALTIVRRSFLGQKFGERRVRLDILDYPGEWLLDLPLLNQTYAQWSEQTLALMRERPRCDVSGHFLEFVKNCRLGDRVSNELALEGHRLYKEALEACCIKHGLRYLQPGRFLCPGPHGDVPLLWFFPMDVRAADVAPAGSLMALLNDRFEAYKRDVRSSFFDTQFRSFDRQVLLVDVLGALYAGRGAFHDTARALKDITTALRYGTAQGFIANRLGGSPRIGRVVFVATKADHVPAPKRDNMRYLLQSLSGVAAAEPGAAGAAVRYQAAASLLSTEDGSAKMEGRPVQVVNGRVIGEDKVRPFYVDVPVAMPADDFWTGGFFELPRFRPPLIKSDPRNGLPHLGLDAVLDDLLGDLL